MRPDPFSSSVTGIGPCPPIADGPGSVVTARYVTRQTADLVTATFADGTELTGTRQHPVWCVTRQAWVGLGELLPGEEVETRQGPLAVRTVEAVPGLQPVYNLEVHGEHVYEVTDVGVLVHNNNSAACLDFASLQRRIDLGEVLEGADLAEYNRLWSLFASKSIREILSGLPGKIGKSGPIKTVPDQKALDELFELLSKGGKSIDPKSYPGVVKELPDGTLIRRRPGSNSGGATMDITLPDGTMIKVHLP